MLESVLRSESCQPVPSVVLIYTSLGSNIGWTSMGNISIVSLLYLVLQLLASPNRSHVSWENTWSLLAATLNNLLTSCSDAPPAASHKALDPPMSTTGYAMCICIV